MARGQRTQVAFAKVLGVDRSCLSRYESEALGAPPSVINFCLQSLSTAASTSGGGSGDASLHQALAYARQAVTALERMCDDGRVEQRGKNRPARSRK